MHDRGYGIGERNPDTLPDGSKSRESEYDNVAATRIWESLGKQIRNDSLIGGKY